MRELTTAEYTAAMAEIVEQYPEYFTTTDDQLRQMADDLAGTTTAYPDRPAPT